MSGRKVGGWVGEIVTKCRGKEGGESEKGGGGEEGGKEGREGHKRNGQKKGR